MEIMTHAETVRSKLVPVEVKTGLTYLKQSIHIKITYKLTYGLLPYLLSNPSNGRLY